MEYFKLGTSALEVSEIGLGCARLFKTSVKKARTLIRCALDEGINLFDHADAYGHGMSETFFSEALEMTPSIRQKIILQSKTAIVDLDLPTHYYDQDKEHILESVNGSLRRLKTDYLDILLLHRPDALIEPEEVAEAFEILHASGKVRYFGVSNHNRFQMEFLQSYISQKLIVDQMQFNPTHTPMLDAGFNVNIHNRASEMHDAGTIDYCRLNKIGMQAWSPFQYGLLEGVYIGSEKYPELNTKLQELAEKYKVTTTVIAIAWIRRHPANFQVLPGSMTPSRIKEACSASSIRLTKSEWYEIYKSSGNFLP